MFLEPRSGDAAFLVRYACTVSPRERVLADALALSKADRIRLARELLESVESVELAPEAQHALDERIDSLERGEGFEVADVDSFVDSLDR